MVESSFKRLEKQERGKAGEDLACRYLKKNGFSIRERNFSSPYGEIDIVALNKNEVYFVEVKMRSEGSVESSLEAVTVQKQKKIRKTAEWYLCRKENEKLSEYPCSFAVIAIDTSGNNTSVECILDAFE
ncbi:MAG: YraN family protein [Deltaproteobacteria bacterium CG_4_10_14_0_2_um_filter_43_8]|nr:MAG: YraN family protein [Deltaproteobacteria bacterium CG11_big_fil_rev_8_21_14_0_20_42_23]PJA18986.1 MAG: YraN family protein [Deltaproteobacteria bacterium CG_4_10_14_0_2_um_filter_43_8]PJC63754.1 MAG: YraN family protein [Deltaproteobacteria bacterium CG_4_9_14_0_2_um_filter_42_21]